ncbi:hypothetical protein FJTKL_15623 [Diaporthe vaccinii]|uniref:DJ-1/PfpI domain-containing protein n=1 Tax=Diaporthe vaccinii TaxID=105482 RepID=A0ABR4F7T4_9PEZI
MPEKRPPTPCQQAGGVRQAKQADPEGPTSFLIEQQAANRPYPLLNLVIALSGLIVSYPDQPPSLSLALSQRRPSSQDYKISSPACVDTVPRPSQSKSPPPSYSLSSIEPHNPSKCRGLSSVASASAVSSLRNSSRSGGVTSRQAAANSSALPGSLCRSKLGPTMSIRSLTGFPREKVKVLMVLYDGGKHAEEVPGLLGTTQNELGIRKWLEDQGHTLVTTSDKEGENSTFDKELVDAEIIITTP